MLQLGGLSDREIDEISRQPRVLRAEIFDEADKWLRRNKMILEREYAGSYVLVNALNQAGVAEQNFDKASRLYQEKYGPTPSEGRIFLGKQF